MDGIKGFEIIYPWILGGLCFWSPLNFISRLEIWCDNQTLHDKMPQPAKQTGKWVSHRPAEDINISVAYLYGLCRKADCFTPASLEK